MSLYPGRSLVSPVAASFLRYSVAKEKSLVHEIARKSFGVLVNFWTIAVRRRVRAVFVELPVILDRYSNQTHFAAFSVATISRRRVSPFY